MKLLIADDHRIVLEGIEALLRGAGHTIVARCTDGAQVLQALATKHPEALILDVMMPGRTGIDILREIKQRQLPVCVVLLSSSINNSQALEAIRLGVNGLILKEAASADLLECLKTVAGGGQWIDPGAARLALNAVIAPAGSRSGASPGLTSREMDIVRYIARGRQNKEIARDLQISEGTVKMHLHRVYEKLGVKNRTELSIAVREQGLV